MNRREVICLDGGGDVPRVTQILHGMDWQVIRAQTPDEAQQLIQKHHAPVALMSFGSNRADTFDDRALEDLLENTVHVAWVALVEPAVLKSDSICRLIAVYFHDYVTAPFRPDYLLQCVGHAYGMAAMEAAAATDESGQALPSCEMLGHSDIMLRVRRTLEKCAYSQAPVTITGESGTGKELAARAIHRHSSRQGGPFVAVNCGAIPENLIQAELFGHAKGAFTGADREKMGRIESARGGTLFLDEIGDLSLSLQVNLLRFLQEGVIEKVGTHQSIGVDTRVVAATHKNLEDAVENGEFRQDLYYRLNVLHVEMPPLREREDDIEHIAKAYLARFSSAGNARAIGFSNEALRLMRSYPWPGNVRELINRVQRAVVMSERRLLSPADLGLDRRSDARTAKTLVQVRAEAEKDALYRSLKHSGDNIAETARTLGISRPTVYRLIEKHGIESESGGLRTTARQSRWQTPEARQKNGSEKL